MGTLPRMGATFQWAVKHKNDWRKTSGVAFTGQPSLFVAHRIYTTFALAAHNRTQFRLHFNRTKDQHFRDRLGLLSHPAL